LKLATCATRFQQRLLATAEELALFYAGTPDGKVEASLADFAERTGKGLRQAYAHVPAAVADGMIAELVERIRKRRREMEVGGKTRAFN
jgi:ketosteroid isomerase-like protein